MAGKLPEIVDEAEGALLGSGEQLFQRSRMLVRVLRRTVPSVRNYKQPVGVPGIVTVEPAYLVETLTRAAWWKKWDAHIKDWKRINAPEQVASTYMARAGHWKLKELWSVISTPTLRPDGTILQEPGYDPELKTWYDPCGVVFPRIPEKPTRKDAEFALEKLMRAFQTIPFEGPVDASVAYSLALCALVRRSLTTAPFGAITAPIMASGKTLLADCIAILATGSSAAVMTLPETDEEAKKTALAVLMEGEAVMLIDNVSRPLQGDWLNAILTQEIYSDRVLGRSEMAKVLTTTLILATGNQLVIAGDLRTRALLCQIDPKTEHPEQREFKVELRDWFLQHRVDLVTAGLTVIRAYLCSGERATVKLKSGERVALKPWGRFDQWSRFAREPLVWLGCEDPCESVKAIEREDPERGAHLQLMHAWKLVFGEKGVTAREAVKIAADAAVGATLSPDAKALEAALSEIASDRRSGQLNSRSLARWLGKHVDRRAGGHQIVKSGEVDHVAQWKVEEVNENKQ